MQNLQRTACILFVFTAGLLTSCKKAPEITTNKEATNALKQTPAKAAPVVPSKPLSLSTNDIVLIKTSSGEAAVIQFTSYAPYTASYRWRYRAPQQQEIQSGTGRVLESYDRKRNPDGQYAVTQRPDHDTTVRIGVLELEWSYGSRTNGWLYPNRQMEVQVLGPAAFDSSF